MAMSSKSNGKITKQMKETKQVNTAAEGMSTDSEHSDDSEMGDNYMSGSSIRGVEDPPSGGPYRLEPRVEIQLRRYKSR